VLNIFQTHYPERLDGSLILNVPFIIYAFFKMIGPFIDPVTREKMKFNPKPVEDGLFTADELFKDGGWGGSRDFVYDHDKYWDAFVRMCDEIREAQMARWRKLGARVGCDEWDYKSDTVVGAAATEKQPGSQDEVQVPPGPSATNDVLANGDSEVHPRPPPEGEDKSEIIALATAI
jgi:hypothetical protein